MSEPRLSGATRELLRAAKNDVPSAGARAKMWANLGGVAGTAAGAAGSAAASAASGGAAGGSMAPGAAAGTAAASKMLALGTLLGGTITVGLAAALLRIGPAPSDVPVLPTAPLAAETAATFASPPPTSTTAAGATGATAASPANAPLVPQSGPPPAGVPAAEARVAAPPAVPAAVHAASAFAGTTAFRSGASVDDTLSREAALVAEARGAIVRGDPQAALRSIHAARQLSSHQLLPEELAVEAQAYRALGREEEAREADSTLKKQFPESALAR